MIYVVIDKHSLNNSMIKAASICGNDKPTSIFKDDEGLELSDYLFIQLADIYCDLFTGYIKLDKFELAIMIDNIQNDVEIKTRQDGINTTYVITE